MSSEMKRYAYNFERITLDSVNFSPEITEFDQLHSSHQIPLVFLHDPNDSKRLQNAQIETEKRLSDAGISLSEKELIEFEEYREGSNEEDINSPEKKSLFDEADEFSKYFRNEFSLEVKEKNHFLESIYIARKTNFELLKNYQDKYPLLRQRKIFLWFLCTIQFICFQIIKSKVFEAFILLIIAWNTIMLILEDPTQDSSYNMLDSFFLIVYTVEMFMKIIAKGLVLKQHSYLRNFWNWVDFLIVITGYLPYIIQSDSAVNISSLRILRVIRPLRAISFLEELKKIVLTLLHALPNFMNVMIIFLFFLFFFGISALQLFSGILKKRCFQQTTGILLNQNYDSSYNGVLCGYDLCPDNYQCGKIIANPNFNVTNFDNIFWCLLMIFETFTLSFNLYYVARTFNYYGALVFFVLCAVVGTFLLVNLMISVISSAYQAEENKKNLNKLRKHSKKIEKVKISKIEFLNNADKYRKQYKLMINFSKDFYYSSSDDILIEKNLRLKLKKFCELKTKHKNFKLEIFYSKKQIPTIRNNQIDPPKWIKSLDETNEKTYNFKLSHQKARKLLKNKKRINLPLIINSKTLKFQLFRKKCQKQIHEQIHDEMKPLRLIQNLSKKLKSPQKENISYEKMIFQINAPVGKRKNYQKAEEFDNEELYYHIIEYDLNANKQIDYCMYKDHKIKYEWPGNEMEIPKYTIPPKKTLKKQTKTLSRINKIIKVLNTKSYDKIVWLNGFKGKLILIRKLVKKIIDKAFFDNFFMICVIANTVILCLDGLVIDPIQVDNLKTVTRTFTYLFLFELLLKIIALGPLGYLRFKSNILDGSIVIISLVEEIFLDNNSLSAFRSIRIFRMLRVLRVVRLLRSMKFMVTIIDVLYDKSSAFLYLFLITFIFLLMYTLIGSQIYAGKLNASLGYKENFENFYFSFLAAFQSMTLTNWIDVLIATLNTSIYRGLTILFLMSLMILGNYVFLNLFIGIMINAFIEKANIKVEDEELDEEEKFKREQENEEQTKRLLKLQDEFEEEQIMAELISKKKIEKVLFEGIECEDSLYIFSKEMNLRKILFKIAISSRFETFILIVILVSSIKLALDTYDLFGTASDSIDMTLNFIFVTEAGFKIISYGFFFDRNSYLRNPWNILDFLIVIISIVDMSLINLNLSFQKIFRLMRILRPLRFITHNESLKIILNALINSIGHLFEVMVVILLIFLIFAIFGMSFLQDSFGQCISSQEGPYNVSRKMCDDIQGTWTIPLTNFDNIIYSLLTIFIMSTLANWNVIMYYAMDSNTSDKGPSRNYNQYIGIFFIFSIIVVNFVMVNLFIGVLCYHFGAAQISNSANSLFLSRDQLIWIDMQKYIIKAKVKEEKENKKRQNSRLKKIIHSNWFDSFIMFCIVFNAVIMSLNYEGSSTYFQNILETFNYAFTGIFIIECLLKIIDAGFFGYIKKGWNKLDLIIVLLSIFDILFEFVIGTTSNKFLRTGPQIIRIFRIVRVVRMLKLIKKLTSLKKIIESLLISLPNVMSVAMLLVLFYYIYAILAVNLFKDIKSGSFIDKYNNFSNFLFSFFTLVGVISGQTWTSILFDCYQLPPNCIPGQTCGTIAAPFFFITFIIIGIFIMQNLFVLVLLGSLNQENTESAPELFENFIDDFRNHYLQILHESKSRKFRTKDVMRFFITLKAPFGFQKNENKITYHLEIMKMQIRCNIENIIDFNDLLFSTLKRVYARDIYHKSSLKTKQYLNQIENKTKEEIDERIKKSAQSPLQRIRHSIKKFTNSPIKIEQRFEKTFLNTLINTLYSKMIFLTWKKYSESKLEIISPVKSKKLKLKRKSRFGPLFELIEA